MPQPPYFDFSVDKQNYFDTYYYVNLNFGQYIDWYNIQYYDQGHYDIESELFVKDTSFSSSIFELINRGIPTNKIVLGMLNDKLSNLTKMTNRQSTSSHQELQEWRKIGGVMVWLYSTAGG